MLEEDLIVDWKTTEDMPAAQKRSDLSIDDNNSFYENKINHDERSSINYNKMYEDLPRKDDNNSVQDDFSPGL